MLVFVLHILVHRGNAVYVVQSPSKCLLVFFSWATTHRTYKVGQQINADVHHLNELKNVFIICPCRGEDRGAGGGIFLAQVSHEDGETWFLGPGATWPACLPGSGGRSLGGPGPPLQAPNPAGLSLSRGAAQAPEGRDNQGRPCADSQARAGSQEGSAFLRGETSPTSLSGPEAGASLA